MVLLKGNTSLEFTTDTPPPLFFVRRGVPKNFLRISLIKKQLQIPSSLFFPEFRGRGRVSVVNSTHRKPQSWVTLFGCFRPLLETLCSLIKIFSAFYTRSLILDTFDEIPFKYFPRFGVYRTLSYLIPSPAPQENNFDPPPQFGYEKCNKERFLNTRVFIQF